MTTTTTITTTKNSRESSLSSLDLDNDNPESNLSGSEPDLDVSSFGSFVLGVGSGLGSSDQHDEAWSLGNLGSPTLTVESSLRSLDQQDAVESSLASLDQHAKEESSDSFDQEGETIGTEKDPSLAAWASGSHRYSFGKTKPEKRVTFEEGTLTAYIKHRQNNKKKQNNRRQHSSQLEQLEHNNKKNSKDSLEDELPKENNKSTTTQTCWNELQQEHKKQQQTAAASAKELEHRICNNNSLDREGQSLGNLESETQTQQACRSPKHNNNTSSLGIGTKNKAAWGIMIDTGAAISLAPMSFAPTD